MPDYLGGCVLEGDSWTYAPEVWDQLLRQLNLRSVLDIGCGAGHALRYFLQKGLDAWGIEGWSQAIEASPVPYRILQHDYVQAPYVPSNVFDLGWCCEFVEHVEAQYLDHFMQTLERCRYVAMTYAEPGQGGYHHVNCQPATYWREIFHGYQFSYMELDSLRLRTLMDGKPHGQHIQRALMLFRNEVL